MRSVDLIEGLVSIVGVHSLIFPLIVHFSHRNQSFTRLV